MNDLKEWNDLSHVVKVMLTELIERHEKLHKYERARLIWGLFALFCFGLSVLYCYDLIHWRQPSIKANLFRIVDQPFFIWLLLINLIGLLQVRFFMKKTLKAEEEYESLRKEFIERNQELWEDGHAKKQRDVIYSYLKDRYDINLYHY